MSKYTFPTQEQYFEDSNKLEVIKKRGTRAEITDFSVLLGGLVDDTLEGKTGDYCTKSDEGDSALRVVHYCGGWGYGYIRERNIGARPSLPIHVLVLCLKKI